MSCMASDWFNCRPPAPYEPTEKDFRTKQKTDKIQGLLLAHFPSTLPSQPIVRVFIAEQRNDERPPLIGYLSFTRSILANRKTGFCVEKVIL